LFLFESYTGNAWFPFTVLPRSHSANATAKHHVLLEPVTAHTIPYITACTECSQHPSWTAWPLQMGPIGCPEMSVTNYQAALHKIAEEQGSHLHW
jgi:hypothetical protein